MPTMRALSSSPSGLGNWPQPASSRLTSAAPSTDSATIRWSRPTCPSHVDCPNRRPSLDIDDAANLLRSIASPRRGASTCRGRSSRSSPDPPARAVGDRRRRLDGRHAADRRGAAAAEHDWIQRRHGAAEQPRAAAAADRRGVQARPRGAGSAARGRRQARRRPVPARRTTSRGSPRRSSAMPRAGIVGGVGLIPDGDALAARPRSTATPSTACAKAYRRACLDDIGGLRAVDGLGRHRRVRRPRPRLDTCTCSPS